MEDEAIRNAALVLIAKYEGGIKEMEREINLVKGAIQRLKACVGLEVSE